MRQIDLTDLLGRECILLESGLGMLVRLLDFHDDGERIHANLEVTHPVAFVLKRVISHCDWSGRSKTIGHTFKIFQPRNQVFRSPASYVHFSSPAGGTRLLFLDEYVEKVRSSNGDGWEWDNIICLARELDNKNGG